VTPLPRIALLDLCSGISGDMLLGALLDLGVDLQALKTALGTLNLPGFDLQCEKLTKKGITCTRVKVQVEEGHHPHRHLSQIESIVQKGGLPAEVIERSLAAFRLIAEAEGKIHGKPPEKIHFHEVGALDAIVDVTGCMMAIHLLGIEKFYASSVTDGTGTVESAHGVLPVPCPATVEILGDFPMELTSIPQEMVTPTGAALLKTLVPQPCRPPMMRIEKIGYGAGTRELPDRANVVRILMGTPSSGETDLVSILETNIDDMSPEIYGYVMDRLFAGGALDVYLISIYGKKNRPGVQVTVLCRPDDEARLAEVLLSETTSLGVRTSRSQRYCMERESKTVDTRWGKVRVKVGRFGEREKVAPEYEDCRDIALRLGIPILDIYEEVHRCYGR